MAEDCKVRDAACETCGKVELVARVLQDTVFCDACWADFGGRSGRPWGGIGSKLPRSLPESAPPEDK